MTKREQYRRKLRSIADWDEYLLRESGLPGPRGNIELAQAVAEEGGSARFHRYLAFTADRAPTNSREEFLAFCGTLGLGRLLAEGDESVLAVVRAQASDVRWRTREAVAMALQRAGEADMDRLVTEMRSCARGTALEQRAAAAALCEPRLLREPRHARAALRILDAITASAQRSRERSSQGYRALRTGLGYCWSVAVAALPEEGKAVMEKWLAVPDRDIRWIMRENLSKARLTRVDAVWVERWRARLVR